MNCTTTTNSWYPRRICHAVSLIDDLSIFKTLPESHQTVLRRLIKKVGNDDGQQPIFARRQTLANETGKSVETVYRALRSFEEKGWIEQRERRAGVGLRGSTSEITFTTTLCDLLDLEYEGKKNKPAKTPRPPVTDASSSNVIAPSLSF